MVFRRSRRLLVTGGSGFLGRHLVGSNLGWEVIAPSSRALDITRRDSVIEAVRAWRPAAIAHLAYRKDDGRVIVTGSRNIAEAAAVTGARLVNMSTDVVFPGRPQPYVETDAPGALNDYGRWKSEAEAAVADACPAAVSVRTSLICGTDRPGHLEAAVRAAVTGQPSVFFTDEIRCPIHADDLAGAISLLATLPDISGPLHVVGPEAIDRYSLARLVAGWAGWNADALVAGTQPTSPPRPSSLILDGTRAAAFGIRPRPVSMVLQTPR